VAVEVELVTAVAPMELVELVVGEMLATQVWQELQTQVAVVVVVATLVEQRLAEMVVLV
jgi:hypothetical protein